MGPWGRHGPVGRPRAGSGGSRQAGRGHRGPLLPGFGTGLPGGSGSSQRSVDSRGTSRCGSIWLPRSPCWNSPRWAAGWICAWPGTARVPAPSPQHPRSGERWEFRRIAPGRCGFFHGGVLQGTAGGCRAAISWPDAQGVRLRHGENRNKPCLSRASEECEYRHGELKIRDDPVETGFHVVLAVGLEDYLRGVAELPDDWTEAGVNQAQAVTARSYAAFKFFQWETRARPANPDRDPGISDARKDSCWCHLYDSWRDINYIGWTKEARTTERSWLEGVETTRDRVLTYFGDGWENVTKGGIVQTFFSASSGGITRSNVYGFPHRTGRQHVGPPVALPEAGRRSMGPRPGGGQPARLLGETGERSGCGPLAGMG